MEAIPPSHVTVGGYIVGWIRGLRGNTPSIHTKISQLKTFMEARNIPY